jgi:hypothetical protein
MTRNVFKPASCMKRGLAGLCMLVGLDLQACSGGRSGGGSVPAGASTGSLSGMLGADGFVYGPNASAMFRLLPQ